MVALNTTAPIYSLPTKFNRRADSVIAIDTEATGLFIHKGCRAFTISACNNLGKIMLWKFKVNPFTRDVKYEKRKIQDFIRTVAAHRTVVFHNANFDLQALAACGVPWQWLFEHFDVHDTMVMSHAYRSSNKHGLKENAILLLDYPDDDETLLTEITHAARRQARKLDWATAEKNDLHEYIEGTQKEHFRCDYWVAEQIAEELGYPDDHLWRTICDLYAGKDAERTIALYYVFTELLLGIKHKTKFSTTRPLVPDLAGRAARLPNKLRFDIDSSNGLILTARKPYKATETLYVKYEESRQLIYPLLDMQTTGIPVKPRALAESKELFTQRQQDTLDELRSLSGNPTFNPRSPKQLPVVIFQKYGFEPVVGKIGKNGPSTDKDVITKLLSEAKLTKGKKVPDKYKFLVALKEYRKETTTLQYINNYDKHSQPTADKPYERTIKPVFAQTRTGTGRLSCTDPNTTNVGKKDMSNPFADDKDKVRATLFSEILGIDTDHRFSLRNVFGPRPREHWTCIDYDQFQLRIFAVVSESYALLEGFERGDDIHMLVARIIFNKEEISDVERTAAKAINFGLLFGAGPDKIELLAGVPGLYGMFTSNFPKAKLYLDTQSRLARSNGYVHTVGGYRLYVPRNAPHAASCYVIQGTEAEIVKRAMVGVHEYQLMYQSPYRLLMMVHDELVLTGKTPDLSEGFRLMGNGKKDTVSIMYDPVYSLHLSNIMQIMEDSGKEIGIPCKVDAKITTTNWADRTSLEFERLAV